MLKNYSEMNGYDYFDRIFNVMSIGKRLQFYLMIWKKGEFKSKIIQELNIQDSREIDIVANELSKLGYLEIIENRDNIAIPKFDAFYVVSEDNLKNILTHICEFSSLAYNDTVFELLQADRVNFDSSVIEKLHETTNNKSLRNLIFSLLIERSVSFFFIHIMEFGVLFQERREIQFFFNDFMIESLLTTLIRSMKLEILEKEYQEKIKERNEEEYYVVKQWKKNIT